MRFLPKYLNVLLAIITVMAAGLVPAFAEGTKPPEPGGTESPHIVEFFLGNTRADTPTGDENALSVGTSYHYLINPTVSIGLLGEYASDPLDSWVVGAPVIFRVGEGWHLTAMPGLEREQGESEFLFRVGAGYEFELNGYSLKPEVSADFVDGDLAIVTGISIGLRF